MTENFNDIGFDNGRRRLVPREAVNALCPAATYGVHDVGDIGVPTSAAVRSFYKHWRRCISCESKAGQICQSQNFRHLLVVDPVCRITRVMIIRMETGEPPERLNIVQYERKLVTTKENI